MHSTFLLTFDSNTLTIGLTLSTYNTHIDQSFMLCMMYIAGSVLQDQYTGYTPLGINNLWPVHHEHHEHHDEHHDGHQRWLDRIFLVRFYIKGYFFGFLILRGGI